MNDLKFPEDTEALYKDLLSYESIKSDYIVNTRGFSMIDGNILHDDVGYLYNTKVIDRNISATLGIPVQYYDKIKSGYRDVLDYTVSNMFQKNPRKNMMLRTFSCPNDTHITETDSFDKIGRALLSDRYKRIDNFSIFSSVVQAVEKTRMDVELESYDITEEKLYMKFVVGIAKKLVNVGDTIFAGFIVTNSEVGLSSFRIVPRITVLSCTNGMILDKGSVVERHLGSQLKTAGLIEWSESTKRKEVELISSQIADSIINYSSETFLDDICGKINASSDELEDPTKAIQLASSMLEFSGDNHDKFVNEFIKNSNNTPWGVVQTLTDMSKLFEPQKRYDVEAKSFDILDALVTEQYLLQ